MKTPTDGQVVVVYTPNGTFKARVELLLAAQFYYEEVTPEGEMFVKHKRQGLMMFNQYPHDWEEYDPRKHTDV